MGVSHQILTIDRGASSKRSGQTTPLPFVEDLQVALAQLTRLHPALALSGLPIYVAASQRALLKQADVHTLLRLPTGILIRSRPLSQPSAFPSHSLLPANSGLRARSEGQRPLDSFAPAQSASRPARLVLRSQRIQVWLKDESLEDSANLPAPGVLALEITEDLEAALAQFAEIAADLKR